MRPLHRLAGARHRGEGHAARQEPCCDALHLPRRHSEPRGFVLCDGAGGSAVVAAAATRGARAGWRALLAVHRQLRGTPRAFASGPALRERFRHAFLHALGPGAAAANHTLLGCLWDRHRLLVAQVGDTVLLLRRGGRWSVPLPPAKGEFANETTFLRADTPAAAIGLWWTPVQPIEAVIGFSDGLEAAFLSPRPGSPEMVLPNAPLLDLVLEHHRRRCGWRGYAVWLAESLADPALRELSDDDRSLVIAA